MIGVQRTVIGHVIPQRVLGDGVCERVRARGMRDSIKYLKYYKVMEKTQLKIITVIASRIKC